MYARVTLFEVDTMRVSMDVAFARFQEAVLPELRKQPGYRGLQVLTTEEGRGMLLTFWETKEAAQAGIESGYYDEQVAKFIMLVRQAPGRDNYEVMYQEGAEVVTAR